ncbi:MAG: hypothetical protein KDD47_28000, partial [Acidobacteria bacterium]|nr:hypothetical protein [Acidobacteriota bacterium]
EAVQSGGAFAIFLGTSVGSFDGVSVRGNMAGLQGGGGFVTGGPSAFVFERTTFEGNTVASAANLSRGGGVYFFGGNVVIDESTFARNVAGGLGGDAAGGAVMAIGTSLLLRNSTLSGNRVETTATFGTEIAAESSAAIRLEFTTVVPWDTAAANTVALAAGSSFEALASIVGGQCAGGGSFTSLGFNVERPPSGSTSTQCGLIHVSDVQAPGPLLRPLAGYGGPTLTHAVLPEGLGWTFLVPSVQCPAADQRGALRSSLFCHAGAFEAETLAPGPWIFSDGFESGDASAWPVVLPGGSS